MKNTKIMAALAIFLVAVLFIGAASAAVGDIASIQLNKTTAFVGDTIEANVTLTEASSGYSFNITNGTDVIVLTISFASALSEEKTFSTTGWTAGSYTITVQNNTNPLVNKSSTLNLVAKDPAYITIADGADAFVFEKIIVSDASATKLTKYSDGASPSAVNQIAGANGQFYLTESVVNGQYGKYVIGNAAFNDATKFVYIWYPELSIKAELTDPATTWGANAGDSIDGKTINKNTNVTFLLNAPKVGPANITDRFVTGTASLSAKVVFTTPVGGKTTVFGVYDNDATANYNAIRVTAAQNIVGSAKPGADAAAGTYTAQAEFTNYKPFADNAKKSNTISFTVQSTSLTLTSGKDSVVRSNPFTTTIQGDANTVYFIYIERTDANQPYLLPGQSGYQSSSTYVNTSSTYKMPWIPTNGGTTPLSPALNDNEEIAE